MNVRNTIVKTFACSLFALTATVAWAAEAGKAASDLSGSANGGASLSFDKEVDEYLPNRDGEFEQRVRQTADEIAAVGDGQIDHSGDSADPTSEGEIDRGRETEDRVPAPPDVKAGDLNGDDMVNVDDLLIVISLWGSTCKDNPKTFLADIAPEGGDCTVDSEDMIFVMLNWGS